MQKEKTSPAVDKKVLVLLAGLLWAAVGVMLMLFARSWLVHLKARGMEYYYLAGFLAAMPIHHFGFLRLADKNLKRLMPLTEKRCVFSFMNWKSYLIVVFMMALGIILRHSAIPRQYLSVLYNGIGLALFFSSIRYFRFFFKLAATRQAPLR